MRAIIIIGFGASLTASACGTDVERVLNVNHCANQTGNDWCAQLYPDGSRPFCEWGLVDICGGTLARDGCAAERPQDDACYSPCGGELQFADNSACLDEASSGSDSGSGTSDTGTSSSSTSGESTGPVPCMGDDECLDAAMPFCEPVSGECVSCEELADGDAACAELDGAMPLCVGGGCVQCTEAEPGVCEGTTPVCDDASNTCVACTEHAQCGEAACNLFSGACLPAEAVVRVGPMEEFATLTDAVASFEAGAEGTIIVHQTDYTEAVTVDGGRTLAFLANGDEIPSWDTPGAGMAPQLTVLDGTVLMDGIQMSGNGSSMDPGLLVDGGRAWVDRGRIVDNNGGGIVAQAGAELVLRSSFVGGDVNDRVAVQLDDANAEVLYSTLGAGFGTGVALACTLGSSVDVRNSMMVSRNAEAEVQCTPATIGYSAAEMDLEDTNTALGDMNVSWFADFGGGNFHLATPPATIATAAQWEDGDPLIDIDGDPRDAIDGTSDVAGADVP